MRVVFFSSISNNTKRFVDKLGVDGIRIPIKIKESITVDEEYILIVPTYSGGNGDTRGAVPKQVIHFLNDENNRKLCRGVIASGNTNHGDTYCIAGPIISNKINVPLLYQFELLGTTKDVEEVKKILEGMK